MRSRKRFGQNFLVDAHTIERIVSAIAPKRGETIVEIGPGHGEITSKLMDSGCRLTVIEIDRDLAADLRIRFPDLNVIESDILKFDLTRLTKDACEANARLRIVGNLPYNISTPLLFKLFRHFESIADMHFMLQLEVVERMIAKPSSANYGRLSVMSQYYCDATKLFSVPAAAFRPRPRVMSAIIRLKPRQDGPVATDVTLLAQMVNEAFSQRRKTIRNALRTFLTEADLTALSLDPGFRPENLALADFVACANYVSERRSP